MFFSPHGLRKQTKHKAKIMRGDTPKYTLIVFSKLESAASDYIPAPPIHGWWINAEHFVLRDFPQPINGHDSRLPFRELTKNAMFYTNTVDCLGVRSTSAPSGSWYVRAIDCHCHSQTIKRKLKITTSCDSGTLRIFLRQPGSRLKLTPIRHFDFRDNLPPARPSANVSKTSATPVDNEHLFTFFWISPVPTTRPLRPPDLLRKDCHSSINCE